MVLSDAVQDVEPTSAQQRVVHATIKKVTEDIDSLSFNTGISQMMVCTNELTAADVKPVSALRALLQSAQPLRAAPDRGTQRNPRREVSRPGKRLARRARLACLRSRLARRNEIELPIQINGKLRERIVVRKDASAAEVEALTLALPRSRSTWLEKPRAR